MVPLFFKVVQFSTSGYNLVNAVCIVVSCHCTMETWVKLLIGLACLLGVLNIILVSIDVSLIKCIQDGIKISLLICCTETTHHYTNSVNWNITGVTKLIHFQKQGYQIESSKNSGTKLNKLKKLGYQINNYTFWG